MKQANQQINYPEERISNMTKNWRVQSLSEILEVRKERNTKYEITEVFSVAKNYGVINQIKHLGRSYASENISNYKIVRPYDLVYTKSPTAEFPFGIVKQNREKRSGVVSVLYGVYIPKNKYLGYLIHEYFCSAVRTYNYLIPIINKGAKNTINISDEGFLRGSKLLLPVDEVEQQKIAELLNAIEEKLSRLTKKIEVIKKYKKGVSQQLFAQSVRFKDDRGKVYQEWEKKVLGQVFERISKKNKENNKNVLTISAQYGLINQQEYFNKSVAAANLTGYYLLQNGEFAYNKSYSNGYPMGAIKKLNRYSKGVVSSLYICFKTKDDNSPEFFEQYFDSGMLNNELSKIAQEGARNHGLLNISLVDFFEQILLQVPSPSEQRKIANLLGLIDERINLEERKLEQAKRFKKSLLQQMFI